MDHQEDVGLEERIGCTQGYIRLALADQERLDESDAEEFERACVQFFKQKRAKQRPTWQDDEDLD